MKRKKILSITLGLGLLVNSTLLINNAKANELTQDQIISIATEKLKEFKSCPVFSTYNKCYEALCAIKDQGVREYLGAQIAPYWNKVATPYVLDGLKRMEALGKDKNLLTFNELMTEIKNSELKTDADGKFNEGYLLGELDAWAKSGSLYTKEECSAIDKIVETWTNKTEENVKACEELIAKVGHEKSRQWLQGEVENIKKLMVKVDKPAEEKPVVKPAEDKPVVTPIEEKKEEPVQKEEKKEEPAQKEEKKEEPVVVVKNEVPVIEGSDITINQGEEFKTSLLGLKATDKEDGDLTGSIEVVKNTVDTKIAGQYEVEVKVTDKQGATATKTLAVTVKDVRGKLVYTDPHTGKEYYEKDIEDAKQAKEKAEKELADKKAKEQAEAKKIEESKKEGVKLTSEQLTTLYNAKFANNCYAGVKRAWFDDMFDKWTKGELTVDRMTEDNGYIISKDEYNLNKAWVEPSSDRWACCDVYTINVKELTLNYTNDLDKLHLELEKAGFNYKHVALPNRYENYKFIVNDDKVEVYGFLIGIGKCAEPDAVRVEGSAEDIQNQKDMLEGPITIEP